MREIRVNENGAGRRVDEFLFRYLSGAPKSLLYKQLRKKNITLNGRKAAENEVLRQGDVLQCFFSDETFDKFTDPRLKTGTDERPEGRDDPAPELSIVYEDRDILIADKPAGLLTQSSVRGEDCLNARLVSLLISRGDITTRDTAIFSPSACHRLDRNTSGLVMCAKTRTGADAASSLLRERTVEKFYLAPVHGLIKEETVVDAPLIKDTETNTVRADSGGDKAVTAVTPLWYLEDMNVTVVRLEAVTGRPHQLRVHMAHISHPIVGDRKYGGRICADDKSLFGASYQLLCCYELRFPEACALTGLAGRKISIEPPFADRFRNGE